MESANNVQHVNKKSSDELLRKFAEMGSDSGDEEPPKKELRLSKQQRRTRSRTSGESDGNPGSSTNCLVERRSLLPPGGSRKSALLRQLGIHGRSRLCLRARDFRNKSLLGTIEKVSNFLIAFPIQIHNTLIYNIVHY